MRRSDFTSWASLNNAASETGSGGVHESENSGSLPIFLSCFSLLTSSATPLPGRQRVPSPCGSSIA